jgi:hypothetical protein
MIATIRRTCGDDGVGHLTWSCCLSFYSLVQRPAFRNRQRENAPWSDRSWPLALAGFRVGAYFGLPAHGYSCFIVIAGTS